MQPNQEANWQYKPSGATATAEKPLKPAANQPTGKQGQPPRSGSVSWQASEFIEHQRGASWYLMLAAVTAVLAGLVFLITRDFLGVGIIVVLAVVTGLFVRRQPLQLTYELNETGLKIGEKLYNYGAFKSFSIVRETALSSFNLVPLKRFMPPVTVYFAAQDEEQIISVLGAHLPYQDHKLDQIDRLARLLKL